jgi:L-alanine-DL-glutamate epimerase-like enolase superfamily enzyme
MINNQLVTIMDKVPRRDFIKAAMMANMAGLSNMVLPFSGFENSRKVEPKTIKVKNTDSNFERETLIRPFGFKGGYMTEMWQSACRLESESGISRIGICTQNVLYADADVFSAHSEAGGNAIMYSLTDRALQLIRQTPFTTPIDLIDTILPRVYAEGQRLTGKKNLNTIFALNALIGVDNAAWLLYAAENKLMNFDEMIPEPYKKTLSYHNQKVAVIFLASYNLPLDQLRKAVETGFFVIKIKIGQSGTQAEMLQKDMDRLTAVHSAIKEARTSQTATGKLIYTLDANARYEKKETLLKLLNHAKKIGAFEQILFIEEPLTETNEENVSDVGIRIAADESAHDEAGALRRLEQGYGAIALKGIAKTLSLSMKIARLAHERGIPCLCADLTVNPILIDWHKNLAARLAPFPGLGMGLMETNGDLNYRDWQKMMTYHPRNASPWTIIKDGVFHLNSEFYTQSAGIFEPSAHYQSMFLKA